MSHRSIIIFCGILLAVSAVAVDIVLPALSYMAEDLSSSYTQVQLIIPTFIFAAGIGQLIWGPLSDRFGRKPILLIGLSGFVFGSLICWLASAIDPMLIGRIIQGFCASSCAVISRAILRDLFSGTELARNIALATMIFALGPIVAPVIGAGLMSISSWRSVLLLLLLFGLIPFGYGLFKLSETINEKTQNALELKTLADNLVSMMKHPQSRFFILMSGPIMAMIIFILIAIPRVFVEQFEMKGTEFALFFAVHGFGIIIGQTVNRWMIAKYGVIFSMVTGATVLVFTTGLILAISAYGQMGPYTMTACLTLFATSYLIVFANAGALTLDPHGSIAGFASSFFGFVSQAGSAIIAMVLAYYVEGDLVKFSSTLFLLALVVFAALNVWRVRQPAIA